MSLEEFYKQKYLKYKKKYLELKNQIGGIPSIKDIKSATGIGDCNYLLHNENNAKNAKEKKCPPNIIKKFSLEVLRDAGYTMSDLKAAGGTLQDIYDIGFIKKHLVFNKEYLQEILIELNYPFDDYFNLKIHDDIKPQFQQFYYQWLGPNSVFKNSLEELKGKYKFELKDFILTQWPLEDLKKIYPTSTLQDFRTAGFNLIQLKNGFKINELKAIISKAHSDEVYQAKFTAKELKESGYTVAQFRKLVNKTSTTDCHYAKNLGRRCYTNVTETEVFPINDLKTVGFTISELIDGNFRKKDLLLAFSIQDINEAFKTKKVSFEQLHKAFFVIDDIKQSLKKEDVEYIRKNLSNLRDWEESLRNIKI
jgi:hypothetical protein